MTTHVTRVAGVVGLRIEHHREALGIGKSRPRLSWRYAGTERVPEWVEIEASGETGTRRARVPGPDQVLAPWPFPPLASRERRVVRARAVAGTDVGPWSDPAAVEAGLLHPDDWGASRMVAPAAGVAQQGAAAQLRRAIELSAPVRRARLYLTSWGVHLAHLNGARVGTDLLAPGWTSYHHRLRYHTHDVTDLLRAGGNTLVVALADGWYRGRLTADVRFDQAYGGRTGVCARLEVGYEDGRQLAVVTDEFWQAAASPVLAASFYDGETRDERHRPAAWTPVEVLDTGPLPLVAPQGPPVRPVETRAPVASRVVDELTTRHDFGQNLVGVLRLRVSGPPGASVTLRHAEVLERDGRLATRPLRSARATDRLLLGGQPHTWQPDFTLHGFRHAEVTTDHPDVRVEDVRAVVVHSDLRRTGAFDCSDPELTRLWENARWSLRGNAVDLPTDCPQRDERLGWTGDIAVFAPAATGLYDCAGFLSSWLADLAVEQEENGGAPPLTVPSLSVPTGPVAVWGDAAVVVPWTLYERYGDPLVLERAWPSMTAWVDLVHRRAGEALVWEGDPQLGDWLDPAAPPDEPAAARTDPDLVATAWFARSARLLARAAAALGRTVDARRYAALADGVAAAFRRTYTTPAGRLVGETQTGYALALAFGLLTDDAARAHAARRLVRQVELAGYRIGTGFAGTPFVLDALTEHGHLQVAYRMLAEPSPPSYRYQVRMGATTMWERWDSLLPDGSVNPGEMTSFNHYAYGAVADWLQRVVGGLTALAPGYRRAGIRPRPGGGLTAASASLLTPYGRLASAWRLDDDRFTLDAEVPPGVVAEVGLPDGTTRQVTAGRHTFTTRHRPDYPPPPPAPRPGTPPGGLARRTPPVRGGSAAG
ncbi:family 78 glycoside hydrolase catalytic domain [Streptomyces sp. DSM 44915]|uniref:alpha-L-rhamnosidase n=1 Tax=Streptomyces chisholmiae TaxID=3075540 RepID=A0ABU2JVP8_9ACTN|nr:family 78 glycoside hydrolase catalytic domain [Streptomyces sp. DSM 44915]MDT0269042.1 family 78 glycoside hydrolase catalytic domain [Streptomyces sp. DSM 44915]